MTQVNNKIFKNFCIHKENKNTLTQNKQNKKPSAIKNTGIIFTSTILGGAGGYLLNSHIKSKLLSEINYHTKQIENTSTYSLVAQLKSSFSDLILREKSGKDTVYPNCIMLVGNDEKINKGLINLIGTDTNFNFEEIIISKSSLVKKLRTTAKEYKERSKRTLLHIKDLCELLNPQKTPTEIIESLKSILSSCSMNYHTTIIFETQRTDTIDKTILQPHRIKKINVNINKTDLDNYNSQLKTLVNLKTKIKQLSKSKNIAKGMFAGILIGIGLILTKLISTQNLGGQR